MPPRAHHATLKVLISLILSLVLSTQLNYGHTREPQAVQQRSVDFVNSLTATRWYPEPASNALSIPINIPTVMRQQDARSLERYLKSSPSEPLNLASMNDRAHLPADQLKAETRHYAPAQQQTNKKHYPPAFLDKWSQNCITKSAPLTSRCEDHLIRRLNQDATEGRTVVDVGRRYCCALFWHKDCINRIVVETCPDSSPAAADFLLGSRKLDLTLSCQRYNRDGCNGAHSAYRITTIQPLISVLAYLLVCRFLFCNKGSE